MDSTNEKKPHLSPPARYFPPRSGHYRVTPDLHPLGTDFGNGAADGQIFQFDTQWAHYRTQKERARSEDLAKYYRNGLAAEDQRRLQAFLVQRLCREHPALFQLQTTAGERHLHCALSGEQLRFGAEFDFIDMLDSGLQPACIDGIDALACQVQEDLSLVQREGDGDRLRCLHLCFPNHWAAADKFGQPFAAVHQPVAGMAELNRRSGPLIDALIQRGPYVRFAWGLASDTRLNHHPEPPPGEDPRSWAGRDFAPEGGALYLRVERQTIHGLPDMDAALFTIRTYFTDLHRLRNTEPAKCARLAEAIASMTPAQRAYKGLATGATAIIDWLRGAPEASR
ncbi:MAG TPA: DUF3445 domain-containing protein [Gammaproteobacteria bacterium]|nr:DUF3445 domain-containing protein [Gammaproteobacteria bacterium]